MVLIRVGVIWVGKGVKCIRVWNGEKGDEDHINYGWSNWGVEGLEYKGLV